MNTKFTLASALLSTLLLMSTAVPGRGEETGEAFFGNSAMGDSPPSAEPSVDRALEVSMQLATEYQHELIAVEHLLLALLDDESVIALLQANGADIAAIRQSLLTYLESLEVILPQRTPLAHPLYRGSWA